MSTTPPQGPETPEPVTTPADSYTPPSLLPRYPLLATIFRAALILLAVVVAMGFILVLMPRNIFEKAGSVLQRQPAVPAQEQIAFLYLGDTVKGAEFHVRGVVRNLMTTPIEKLDANVRLYSPEGRLLETRVVRMDTDTIAPDAIAQFNLIYPNYSGQFGSYSVDFTLRDGQPVPYKDMRSVRGSN